MRALWEHYRFYVRKNGLVGSAKSVIRRWRARTFGQWERLYSVDLSKTRAWGDHDSTRLVAFRNPAEINDKVRAELRKYKSERAVSHFLNRWFSRGATLWSYFIDQDVVGVQWTIPRGFNGFYSVPIGPGEIIIVAVEVFPLFRGRGLYPHMANRLYDELRIAGYSRAYLKVAASNLPMLRSMAKTPAEVLGQVYTLRLPGKWLTIWRREPEPLGALPHFC